MWAAIAVVLLGLVAIVLFTPVELTFRCERRPAFRCRVAFQSLFGLVDGEVTRGSAPSPAERRAEPSAGRHRRRSSGRPKHVTAMLMSRGFLSGALRLVTRLGHAFRLQDPHLWLRAGFEDPADTGRLCAWLMPAGAYLDAWQPGRWDVAPVFTSPMFAFSMRARVRLTVARLLWPVLFFFLSPSTLRGFIALRTGRVG